MASCDPSAVPNQISGFNSRASFQRIGFLAELPNFKDLEMIQALQIDKQHPQLPSISHSITQSISQSQINCHPNMLQSYLGGSQNQHEPDILRRGSCGVPGDTVRNAGVSSLLLNVDDQEYNSNNVSRNLKCRASRGRLQSTKTTAVANKDSLKQHRSCENLIGQNKGVKAPNLDMSLLAKSFVNCQRGMLTVRSR